MVWGYSPGHAFEQIEPELTPMPTVIDHEHEAPQASNLLSVFPGRASLWPQLAEAGARRAGKAAKRHPSDGVAAVVDRPLGTSPDADRRQQRSSLNTRIRRLNTRNSGPLLYRVLRSSYESLDASDLAGVIAVVHSPRCFPTQSTLR